MDVVFLVPRFHPRDACLLPVVSPCSESVFSAYGRRRISSVVKVRREAH
jgi:hypothetical protein